MDELAQIRLFGCIQSTISSIVLICLLILIVGILKSKQTRSQPFNAYVISLELSDAAMNIVFLTSSIWYLVTSAENNTLDPTTVKRFWDIIKSILIFTTASNMWLNGIVGYHIYKLLQNSHMARHIDPPTIKRVIIETLLVYVFAGFLSWLYYWLATNEFDHITTLQSIHAGILFVTIFGPLFPMIYISYITIKIYQYKLLPITGRTRTLTIYFGRIVIIFFAFYLPGSIFFASGAATKVNWCRNLGVLIYALQGGFSFLVALKKPDIYDAVVIKFLKCNNNNNNNNMWLFNNKKETTTEYNNYNNHTDITRATTENRPSNLPTIPMKSRRIEKYVVTNNNNNYDDIEAESNKNLTSSSSLPAASSSPPRPCNNNDIIIGGGGGSRSREVEEVSPSRQHPSPATWTTTTTTTTSSKQQQDGGHYPDSDDNDEKFRQSLLPPNRRSLSPPQPREGTREEDRSIQNKKKKKTKTKTKTSQQSVTTT